jgi:predicted Zn-dependent peptidase
MYRKFFGGSNGPGINVYTVHSHTGYGHQDLFHPRHRNEVFQVMAGNVRDGMYDVRNVRRRDDAIITPRSFFIERRAVANETSGNDEHPFMAGCRAALKALYRTNPARNWGDSDPEQLAKLKLGTLKLWAQVNIVPETMRVVIIGPKPHVALRMVREAKLTEMPRWNTAPWWYDRSDDVPVLTEVRRVELSRRDIKKRHVCMLWPTETWDTKDALALEVAVGLLKDRIEYEQREANYDDPGGVYHPEVDWDASSSHGYFMVSFETDGSDEHTEDLIRRTLQVIEHAKTDTSSTFGEDVEDGKFYLANAYLERYKFMPGALADQIMEHLANGDEGLVQFSSYYEDMMRISPYRVRRAIAKYLHSDRFVQSIVRPAP